MAYQRRPSYPPLSANQAIEEGGDRGRIRKSIQLLGTCFGKRLDADMVTFWVNRLEKLAGPRLWNGLAQACEEERFPTLKRLVEIGTGRRDTVEFVAPPALTSGERQKSDFAAIMSMLWLHYFHDWALADFSGHILGRQFIKQMEGPEGRSIGQILVMAKEKYPKEVVGRWMEQERERGN